VRLSFEVEGETVTCKRDPWFGRATLTVGDETRVIDKVLDPTTQVGIATTRFRAQDVKGHQIVITKVCRRFFGGLRRQDYAVLVDGSEVARRFGY
jgi:hypothetical protein